MPLKPVLTKAGYDALQPPERLAYREDGSGGYVVDLDGELPELVSARAKLDEFRDNNRTLNGKVGELEARLAAFDGIDPLAAGQPELAEKLAAAEAARKQAEDRLAAERLRSALTLEATKRGIRPDAVDYVFSKAGGAFSVDAQGRIVSTDAAGFNPERPGERLTLAEWLDALTADHTYLVQPSRGGGAGPANRGPRQPDPRVIASDPETIGRHLEQLASGKVRLES